MMIHDDNNNHNEALSPMINERMRDKLPPRISKCLNYIRICLHDTLRQYVFLHSKQQQQQHFERRQKDADFFQLFAIVVYLYYYELLDDKKPIEIRFKIDQFQT